MAQVAVKSVTGAEAGSIELDERIFGITPNVSVMHQVVTAQLAAKRSGSQSTKTRAEVRGGGAKPWKQKGTGRARQGSIRAPQWKGGGVALGPKPRDHSQKTPKKMVRLALRSALSDRAAENRVVVVDAWDFEVPKTKQAVAALEALGVEGRALVVLRPDDRDTWLSFRNLHEVHIISPGELNAYDVLVSDYVVFSRDTVPAATDGPTREEREARARSREAAALVREAKAAKTRTAKPVPSPPSVPEQSESESVDDPTGGDDMPSDLPNRDKLSDELKGSMRPVDPTERVKSVAEKEDPRFAAAREKADKEDRLRERAGKAQEAAEADAPADGATDDSTPDDSSDDSPKTKSSFSWNMTGEDQE